MTPRALVCAFSFPPLGDPTSYRWLQFSKHLSEAGWNLDILTCEVGSGYPGYDVSPLKHLPDTVRIYRTYPGPYRALKGRSRSPSGPTNKKQMPKGLAGLKQDLRLLTIPDRMVEWLPFALWQARRLVRQNGYDLIVSSSFPFTSHLVGVSIKRWTCRPWIGDISDPYAFMPEFRFPQWRQWLDERIESWLLKEMSCIVVPTYEMREIYLDMYPSLQPEKLEVVSYGFDEEQVSSIQPERSSQFRIVYTGIFYRNIRSPYSLFEAVRHIKDLPLELIIAGEMEPEYVQCAASMGLSDCINFLGHQPRDRAIALQKGADVLLLIGNKGGLQLPGKVFDYIAANRPILHIRNDAHDIAANVVQRLGRGQVVENDPSSIADAIRTLYSAWQQKRLDGQFRFEDSEDFSWQAQASKFAAIMNRFSQLPEYLAC